MRACCTLRTIPPDTCVLVITLSSSLCLSATVSVAVVARRAPTVSISFLPLPPSSPGPLLFHLLHDHLRASLFHSLSTLLFSSYMHVLGLRVAHPQMGRVSCELRCADIDGDDLLQRPFGSPPPTSRLPVSASCPPCSGRVGRSSSSERTGTGSSAGSDRRIHSRTRRAQQAFSPPSPLELGRHSVETSNTHSPSPPLPSLLVSIASGRHLWPRIELSRSPEVPECVA